MPAKSVLIYPDARLRMRATPIIQFDTDLEAQAQDLVDTVAAVSAIGLAGPHIGWLARIVVLRLEPGAPASVYVNPDLTGISTETGPQTEGSVSMPGIWEAVDRLCRVRVRYRGLDGVERVEEAEGFRAACLQHEIDQLDGIFWIDRLSRLRRDRALRRFAKLRRNIP